MHIQVDIRGYESEKTQVEEVKQRIKSFIEDQLVEELMMDEKLYPDLEETDEIIDTLGWHTHIYPDNPDEYKFFGCMPY